MKIAIVFSGQGAQKQGMGKDLYDNNPAFAQTFNKIDETVASNCFHADETKLARTDITQPCIYAVSVAAYAALEEVLRSNGKAVSAVAGFSLGEYSALTASGVIGFDDCFNLVKLRGKLMQEANETSEKRGAMAAVLGDDVKRTECLSAVKCEVDGDLWEVNFNCPGQVVVAGDENMIEQLVQHASNYKLKCIKLAVNGAFHSPYMQQVSQQLSAELEKIAINKPCIPMYFNVTGKAEDTNLAELITEQVKSPVLWQTTIENMISDGIDTFIEVGIGNTLCGLIRKINRTVKTLSVVDTQSLEKTIEYLRGE